MANELQNNINKKLLKSFAKSFESSTVLKNTVSSQLVNDFDASTGRSDGQVSMKRPPQYSPQRTFDGDMTGLDKNPISTGQVQASVSDYITVYIENEQVEEALETDQLNELMAPVAEDMVVTLETELASYMANNAQHTVGDPQYRVNKWSDMAYGGSLLKDIGAPSGKRYGVFSSFDETSMANLQTQLGVNPEVNTAWSQAVVKEGFAGLTQVLTTNNLPQYTTGDKATHTVVGTPSSTYQSYANTYRMGITVDGFTATTGSLKAGTTFEFTASNLINMRNHNTVMDTNGVVTFKATVLPNPAGGDEYLADISGEITCQVSGAAIYELGVLSAYNTVDAPIASGDSVVILEAADTTYRPALAYCEGFVGCGSVVLPKLHATESMVMNHKNTSIRVHKFSDGEKNLNRYRFDILPTFACFNPAWGVRVNGTAPA